jgi:predicted transposase YbfD/YdcC
MDLNRIKVRPILMTERSRWRDLCNRHHYLGFDRKFGHQILYCVEYSEKWIGLIGWASAFSQVPCRDEFIGWNCLTKPKKLEHVANNFRFLLLPGYNQKNLASKAMSLNLKRLGSDWKQRFYTDLLLVETFVNSKRFSGTLYKASGWSCIGRTKGFSYTKDGWIKNNEPKDVFIKPLFKKSLKQLSDTSFKIHNKESRLVDINSLSIEGKGGLIDVLKEIEDPRGLQGRRFPFYAVMSVVTCAMLSGANSFLAIHEWSKKLKKPLLKKLRCRKSPGLTTMKDLVYKIDAEQFDEKINKWLSRQTDEKKSTGLAVDGKTLRGSKDLTTDKKPVQLLSALLHHEKMTIAQTKIESKTNEIPKLKDLLAGLDIEGKVVTADALHCQKGTIKFLVEKKKSDFVVIVKNNQPKLLNAIKTIISEAPTSEIRSSEITEKSHGRIDTRKIDALSIHAECLNDNGSDFPHVHQIFQITRQSNSLKGKKIRGETVFGLTSATEKKYEASDLAQFVRDHWSIENSSHYVRDETFKEDRSRIRTGSAPQVMATIRNLSIGIIRLSGEKNIASGVRHFEWGSKADALRAIGIR